MKAIEILVNEHRVILQKLEEINVLLPNLGTQDLLKIRNYMNFIQIYADEFHHAKEEGILFPWMLQHQPDFEFGPIACMLKEHEYGRELVRSIITLVQKNELLKNELELLKTMLHDFISMLTSHIGKEDNVLYQFAEKINDQNFSGDDSMMPGFFKVENELGEKARLVQNSLGF